MMGLAVMGGFGGSMPYCEESGRKKSTLIAQGLFTDFRTALQRLCSATVR